MVYILYRLDYIRTVQCGDQLHILKRIYMLIQIGYQKKVAHHPIIMIKRHVWQQMWFTAFFRVTYHKYGKMSNKSFTSTLCYSPQKCTRTACINNVLHCTVVFCRSRATMYSSAEARTAWNWKTPWACRSAFLLYFLFYQDLSKEWSFYFLDSIFPCKHLSIALPGRLSDLVSEPLPDLTSFFWLVYLQDTSSKTDL